MGWYADLLRSMMRADGRSLRSLAKGACIDPSHLARWLDGRTDISLARADRLYAELEAKPEAEYIVDCQATPTEVETVSPRVEPVPVDQPDAHRVVEAYASKPATPPIPEALRAKPKPVQTPEQLARAAAIAAYQKGKLRQG